MIRPQEDSNVLESIGELAQHECPGTPDIYDEFHLLMLLWSYNWDLFYWLLLALGLSFLNFEIYSIFLLSNPLFFASLCASLGIFNPVIIFTLATFVILSIGFILSTLIYAIYTFWKTYNQISDETLDAIIMWYSPKISIVQVIKLLKDDKFLMMTSTLSNFVIPEHIKELIFQDASYRFLVLNIFYKLHVFLPLYDNQDIFAQDFLNFIIRIYPKNQTDALSRQLFQCFDLLIPEHTPSHKIIQKILEFTATYHHNYLSLSSLKNSLDHNTYYKILFHINFLPLVEEGIKISRDKISHTLNEFFYYAKQANIVADIDCLTPRPLSPIHSFSYFQKIKCNIFKYIWESFHNEPNQFWTIWQNISNHPNIDSIYPLIIQFCHHNECYKSLYSCIIDISHVGWEHEVDIYKLNTIYTHDEQKRTFISIISLLLDLNALIPQFFMRIILHPNHDHLYQLLYFYKNHHDNSKNTLKEIYLLISLSKKKHLISDQLQIWEEVEAMIMTREENIPHLNYPSPRRFIRSFSSRMQLSPITEDCDLNP